MIGKTVQVQTMNGVTYEGILHAAAVDKGQDVGVALKMAYKCTGRIAKNPFSGSSPTPSKDVVLEKLVINGGDVAQIFASGIDLGFKAPPPDAGGDGFTDTGISGGKGPVRERTLEMWTPDADDPSLGDGMLSLESGAARSKSSGWSAEDMFAKNKRDHNYSSTYNENDYTTAIDKNNPQYQQRMEEANRLAKDINNGIGISKTSEPHRLLDRNVDVDIDEESLYGSVQREESGNSYVIPHLRKNGKPQSSKISMASSTRDKDSKSPVSQDFEAKKASLKGFSNEFKLGKAEDTKELNDATKADTVKKVNAASVKLNPNAKEFSFNPEASSFTPKASAAPVPAMSVFPTSPHQQHLMIQQQQHQLHVHQIQMHQQMQVMQQHQAQASYISQMQQQPFPPMMRPAFAQQIMPQPSPQQAQQMMQHAQQAAMFAQQTQQVSQVGGRGTSDSPAHSSSPNTTSK